MTGDNDVIVSYNFEPDGLWSSSSSSSEESDSDGSQASFTEWLGNTSCVAMPRTIECTCCRELPEVEERFEESKRVVLASQAA